MGSHHRKQAGKDWPSLQEGLGSLAKEIIKKVRPSLQEIGLYHFILQVSMVSATCK